MLLRLGKWRVSIESYRELTDEDRAAVEKALEGWARQQATGPHNESQCGLCQLARGEAE